MNMILKEAIEQKIYIIRGRKVMISFDLAGLFHVNTSAFMQSVMRNKKRFPDDFMFILTRDEIRDLSQIVMSSDIKHARNVYAFSEEGVAINKLMTLPSEEPKRKIGFHT